MACHWISSRERIFRTPGPLKERERERGQQTVSSRVRVGNTFTIFFYHSLSPRNLLFSTGFHSSSYILLPLYNNYSGPFKGPVSLHMELIPVLAFVPWTSHRLRPNSDWATFWILHWLKLWLSKRNSCAFWVKICVRTSPLHDEINSYFSRTKLLSVRHTQR